MGMRVTIPKDEASAQRVNSFLDWLGLEAGRKPEPLNGAVCGAAGGRNQGGPVVEEQRRVYPSGER